MWFMGTNANKFSGFSEMWPESAETMTGGSGKVRVCVCECLW